MFTFNVTIKNDIKAVESTEDESIKIPVISNSFEIKDDELYLSSTSLCTKTKNLLTQTNEITFCFSPPEDEKDKRSRIVKIPVKYLYGTLDDTSDIDIPTINLDGTYYIRYLTFRGGCCKIDKGIYTFTFTSLKDKS